MDILLNAVLTINALGILWVATWFAGRTHFGPDAALRARLAVMGFLIVALKVAYVQIMVHLDPAAILTSDAGRYFFEMSEIAKEPWLWNPFMGRGPGYSGSAKMGMSYFYGLVMFIHGVRGLYPALLLNVVFAYLTCLMALGLTRKISSSANAALLAMFLAAIHPELLFWNARVLRENMSLFLVPALVYASLEFHETHRPRHLLYILLTTGSLLLVRAQLSMFILLIAGYFGFSALWNRNRTKACCLSVLIMAVAYLGFGLIKQQVSRAAGSDILKFTTFSLEFWWVRLKVAGQTLPGLLSFFARRGHGDVGAFLAPLSITAMLLFGLACARFGKIFSGRRFSAGLIIFLVVGFLFMVASWGFVNIRFRSTVMPLVLSVVSVAICHYWQAFRLPLIRTFGGRVDRAGSAAIGIPPDRAMNEAHR